MAYEVNKVSGVTAASEPNILYNSDFVGKAVTLDTTAFTGGVCKAGMTIDKDGKKAVTTPAVPSTTPASTTAIGILLHDVYQERPQGTLVIGGYIKTAVAQTHSGHTVDETEKAALKNIVFM